MNRPSGFRLSSRVGEGYHLAVCSKAVIAFAFLSAVALARAQDQSASSISREVKDVFERASSAVVKIHGADEHSEIVGTGFFVDPTGTIYTCYSVGGEGENFTVEFGGKTVPARQAVADVRSGLAMLKV